MNEPTDIELQKILAEELTDLLGFEVYNNLTGYMAGICVWILKPNNPANRSEIIGEREWLWVVAQCEKKLQGAEQFIFLLTLYDMENSPRWVCPTWQQRAIAYFKTVGKL